MPWRQGFARLPRQHRGVVQGTARGAPAAPSWPHCPKPPDHPANTEIAAAIHLAPDRIECLQHRRAGRRN